MSKKLGINRKITPNRAMFEFNAKQTLRLVYNEFTEFVSSVNGPLFFIVILWMYYYQQKEPWLSQIRYPPTQQVPLWTHLYPRAFP